MTTLYLLLWIVGGILLQLTIYFGIAYWRTWQNYEKLRVAALYGGVTLPPEPVLDERDATRNAWAGWRTFSVSKKVMENAAQDICSFYLVPQDGKSLPSFLPGQYLTLRLELPSSEGTTEGVTRCYSLSDAPEADGYRISVKRAPAPLNTTHPAGRGSNFLHEHVQAGSLLQVRAPAGHFYIDRSAAPVVLLGGGIGITPMLSMVNWCFSVQPAREVWLFYGARNARELMAQPELEALAERHTNFHFHVLLSDAGKDVVLTSKHHRHGRIDIGLLRQLLPLKPYHFYLCGPTPMLESLVPALESWGVADAFIHFEAFGPASVKRKTAALASALAMPGQSAGEPVMVTFAKSGKQVAWQPGGGNLLAFAEGLGIAVEAGCRAGSCGSCQTSIQQGEVRYDQAPDFDPEPGSCLMCVCTPVTPLTLEL